MSHYGVGRVLASVVAWGGWTGIGLGLLVILLGGLNKQMFASGSAGLMMILWGAMAALMGNVGRAIFDIADKLREPVAALPPDSIPIPLGRRDPG